MRVRKQPAPVALEHVIDIVWDGDDGGWYALRHSDDAVTAVYQQRTNLTEALAQGQAIWTGGSLDDDH